ncbi:MAG: hypothetical protein WD069_03475 [Planctomycetales bacterium]
MHAISFRLVRRQAWAALAAASLCSCAALSRPAEEPETVSLGPAYVDSVAFRPPEEARQIALAGGLQHGAGATSEPEPIRNAGRIERMSAEAEAAPPVAPAPAGPAPLAIQFSPAEPRIVIDEGGPAVFPDEYLYDGGDRGLPVHYDRFNRLGLDTEDTIAEYSDDRGGRHVQPSNRVALYAPRFAAVRTMGFSQAHVGIDHAAAARERTRSVDALHRLAPTRHDQRLAGSGLRVRSRPSLYEVEQARSEADQVTRVSEHQKLNNLYQSVAFLRTGRLDETDSAWLAARIEAAITWSRDQSVVISAKVDGAQLVEALAREDAFVGTEENVADGPLRIVKLADRGIADRGDIVTFTIRYDNLGDRPVHHVRIVDNLTPRLEYVADSAESDRAGRLVVQDNEEGSLVLIFEVDEPVPGRQGGVVTFQARVK